MTDVRGPDATAERCPGGPLIVRSATAVVASDGTVWPVTRPVVAVCRCRRSDRLPWCDSSHKLAPEAITVNRPDRGGEQ